MKWQASLGKKICHTTIERYYLVPDGSDSKEPAYNAGDPWVRKIPWRREWQPLQYSCLENPMDRERSLVDYSPWGHKELETTE